MNLPEDDFRKPDRDGPDRSPAAVAEKAEAFFQRLRIAGAPLLAAVSGGADSIALASILGEIPQTGSLTVAHINHHLRGSESDGDERFVASFCSERNIPFVRADAPLDEREKHSHGVEAAARKIRYRVLEELRRSAGAAFVATAHTRDDQAETLLIRLITGRAPGRLSAIREVVDGTLIRPLLEVRREDLLGWLRERGLEFRVDSSNSDLRFLRNRVRHELLPLLHTFNPRIAESLGETARYAAEENDLLTQLIVSHTADAVLREPLSTTFHLEKLDPSPALRRRLLAAEIRRLDPEARDFGSAGVERLLSMLGRPGKATVTKTLEFESASGKAILRIACRGPGRKS